MVTYYFDRLLYFTVFWSQKASYAYNPLYVNFVLSNFIVDTYSNYVLVWCKFAVRKQWDVLENTYNSILTLQPLAKFLLIDKITDITMWNII